jgi:hypothetical protein
MEKFDSQEHLSLANQLPFSYYSLPLYLDFCAYLLPRNNEQIIVAQDFYYPHEFPALFLPQDPANWENFSVTFATAADIEKIKQQNIEIILQKPAGTEFFYRTKDLINPDSKIAQRIRQFNKLYEYKIFNDYPQAKIRQFYQDWQNQRERSSDVMVEEEKLFFFGLENLSKYDVKQVYVEINGQLAGLAWGVAHPAGGWVGLHLKTDYRFKGLSRFLHQQRAQLFADKECLALGTGVQELGITQFKKELGPAEEKEYSYILTGGKINAVQK